MACGERRASTRSSLNVPLVFSGALACATMYSSSSSAARYAISSVTLPLATLRYGDSMKPNSLTRAYVDKRADEADVRTFRRLDRAHAAVVREVHVADLEAGPLPRQAARAERAEAAAVGQTGQRVDLVHELAQLAGAEELLDRGHDRPDVDEGLRRDRLHVLRGHALLDDALHAGQADAHLVLDQLTDRTDAAVGEVVLVVEAVARRAVGEVQQVAGRGEHLAATQHRLVRIGGVDEVAEEG